MDKNGRFWGENGQAAFSAEAAVDALLDSTRIGVRRGVTGPAACAAGPEAGSVRLGPQQGQRCARVRTH